MTWLARYIPHRLARRYRLKGWTIKLLPGHHRHYAVLAVKLVVVARARVKAG